MSISDDNAIVFQLEKNPIEDQLVLLSKTNTIADIIIIDVTGKTVYNSTLSLDNRTSIPIDLTTGFYFLNVVGENNTVFSTKLVAN